MQGVRPRFIVLVVLCGALGIAGCRDDESFCPAASVSVDPVEIPEGDNEAAVTLELRNPNPDNGREVLTELYADSGTFADPNALETTYRCAHDEVGELEICVDVAYGPPIGPGPGSELIAAALQYVRGAPTGYFVRPEDCLETSCANVVCPEAKNECPVISDFSVTPEVLMTGESALVRVVASDPDSNPAPLLTTLTASAGSFGDVYAKETSYSCDPRRGGQIEICVLASDGDDTCDQSRCVTVECPGPAPDNVCPVIRDLTATPSIIPVDERQSLIQVDAVDPDMKPDTLRTILSASAGTFDDRFASSTLFTCGAPGPAEITVRATDGDGDCDRERTITVQCPSTVADNLCPKLYVVNAIPSEIPEGQGWTEVQTRAEDFDDGPLDLVTSFYAFRGTFEDPNAENTIYTCERSGLQEVCVDAFDGACVKTLCMDVLCPQDLGQ